MRVAHSSKPAVRPELLRKALGSAPELRLERDRGARRLQRRLPRRRVRHLVAFSVTENRGCSRNFLPGSARPPKVNGHVGTSGTAGRALLVRHVALLALGLLLLQLLVGLLHVLVHRHNWKKQLVLMTAKSSA